MATGFTKDFRISTMICLIAMSCLMVFAFPLHAHAQQASLEDVERTIRLYIHSIEKGLWEVAFSNYLHHELKDNFYPLIPELKKIDAEIGPKTFENPNIYWTEIGKTEEGVLIAESHMLYTLVPEKNPLEEEDVSLAFRLANIGDTGWRIVAIWELPIEIAKAEMISLARMEIQTIGFAVEVFHSQEGRYPTPGEMQVYGQDNVLVRRGLLTNYGPDPWGMQYVYVPPNNELGAEGMLWTMHGDLNDKTSPGKPSDVVKEHKTFYIIHL